MAERRLVLPYTPRGAAEYALHHGWPTAVLRGDVHLVNPNGNPYGTPPQVGYPSVYQGLPNTAATLLQWLGSPAGWTAANVLAVYQCDTASPLVCSLGLGPNLVAAGGPLTGRECVGLGQAGSFNSKIGVEVTAGAQAFEEAVASAFWRVAAGGTLAVGIVFRVNTNTPAGDYRVLQKENGWATTRWFLSVSTAYMRARVTTVASGDVDSVLAAIVPNDGGWHIAVINIVNGQVYLRSDLGTSAPSAFVGAVDDVGMLSGIFHPLACPAVQVAYVFTVDREVTAPLLTNFWRHAQTPVPFAYARTNPLVCPISASRVAAYGAGQAAVGYDAALVTAALGNPLGTGYLAEDGASFLGLGTDNMPAWVGTNATVAAADGPSGMRDAARVADADGVNAGYATSGLATLAGATAVPFRFATQCQAVAAGGLNAVLQVDFTGDAGGSELFTVATLAGTVPAAWGKFGGTVTPIRNAHTGVVTRSLPTDGVGASSGSVDFAEQWGVQNSALDRLAHRRVATGAAAATSTPEVSMVNTAHYIFSPLRGRIRLIIGGFQGTSGATFLQFGAAAAAGSLTLDYNAGQLRLRLWDGAAALIATLNCGAVNTARHVLDLLYDSAAPIRGGATGGYLVVREGAAILGEGGAAWVAATVAVTPLRCGADAGVANAARCFIELTELRSCPGDVQDY